MSKLFVVFGAGQVGSRLARALRARGLAVRVVRRSETPVGDGIEVVACDVRDREAAIRAAAGASVVFHCTNPSGYGGEVWARELPVMGEAVIAASRANNARLVVLDNLYAYGPTEGPRTEATPHGATGRKGRSRAAWASQLHRAGQDGLRWTAGRAGDFFGPGTTDQSLISEDLVHGIARGRPGLLVGRAHATHAFSYIPDVVDGLIALALAGPEVEGTAWHLPVHPIAPAELVRRIGDALGRRAWHIALPAWFVRGLGFAVPLFRELDETLYQWDRPFLVSDAAFRDAFPDVGATLDEAIAGTAALARRDRVNEIATVRRTA